MTQKIPSSEKLRNGKYNLMAPRKSKAFAAAQRTCSQTHLYYWTSTKLVIIISGAVSHLGCRDFQKGMDSIHKAADNSRAELRERGCLSELGQANQKPVLKCAHLNHLLALKWEIWLLPFGVSASSVRALWGSRAYNPSFCLVMQQSKIYSLLQSVSFEIFFVLCEPALLGWFF
jgi:hypothetical protein